MVTVADVILKKKKNVQLITNTVIIVKKCVILLNFISQIPKMKALF